MRQKLPVDGFKWVENTSKFSKDFIENYNEDSNEGYFLEVDIQYHENLHNLHNDSLSLLKRIKIEKVEKIVAVLHDKKRICYTYKKF